MAELGDRFGGADVDGTMNERIETGHLFGRDRCVDVDWVCKSSTVIRPQDSGSSPLAQMT